MVAGHLQEKKGYFYAVLSFKDYDGRRKTKWIASGLPVKGNKKRAEVFLQEQRVIYSAPPESSGNEKFADYLFRWLQIAKTTVALTTYASYSGLVRNPIEPWFRESGVTLRELTPAIIQEFYTEQVKRVKPNTVIHYHAVIRRALKYAVRTDLIAVNPAEKVDVPRKTAYQAEFYTADDLDRLFAAVRGTVIEVPVRLASFYGLRRSEVLGLKWDAIDFAADTISIRHTVTGCNIDGKYTILASDSTKTKSSRRTLPLVKPIKDMLLRLREQQEENKRICGKSWANADGYLCVNSIGERMKPAYLSAAFSEALDNAGLRHIRFHDLRHSCASLLLANGIQLKQIQEWLGHSDFSTTANIYAHLDSESKIKSAKTMEEALKLGE